MSTGTWNEQERAGRPTALRDPQGGLADVLVRLKDAIREDRITLIAAGVAFYAMLALFLAMIVVVSIYGLVMDPDEIAAQVRTLGVLPGDAIDPHRPARRVGPRPRGRLSLSLALSGRWLPCGAPRPGCGRW